MATRLMATIGAMLWVDGALIDVRVWADDDDPDRWEYRGACTRGGIEILLTTDPYPTAKQALAHACAEALDQDARRASGE